MDWVRDNLQLIIIGAGAIAFWINQARREKNGEPADYDNDGVPDNRTPPFGETREMRPLSRDGSDPAQDERVRQIQEEIRRKIAERRGQGAPPPMPAPELEPFNPLRPVFGEQPFEEAPPRLPPQPPAMPTVREVVVHDDQAALERQRRMAEQLEELETRREEARRAAQAARSAPTVASHEDVWGKGSGVGAPAAVSGGRNGPALGGRALAAELRDPQALRRAMVLREVLDPPVALR